LSGRIISAIKRVMIKIYLDVCCWNRPFDDQMQTRIHLEAEAVLAIISQIERGHFQLLHSEIVDLEIANAPDLARRKRLQALIPRQHYLILHEQQMSARALELERRGFAGVDALHLACAEIADADIFLTTDDRLLRLASRHEKILRVAVANPLAWMQDNP
jgi:predicted nucleic acid-binding protein